MKRLSIVAAGVVVACAAATATHPAPAAGDQVIPTRYLADRIFATAVLERGDTATFFLDTGSGTYVFDTFIPFLEVVPLDTLTNSRGVKVPVMSFPSFRANAALPPAIVASPQGKGLLTYVNDWRASNNFVAWISRESQGELGNNWFNGRVWTFDYPRRRLVLHASSQANAPGRELPMRFIIDSTGHRVGHNAWVDVVIDGDTVAMQFDTGATIWLSKPALDQVADGGPSERSTSHLPNWEFERLHQRHPDWPVILRADLWLGLALIRVPRVSFAGFELGPTWMSVLPGTTTAPAGNPSAPWTKRQGGTIGGSLLKSFVITADYPAGTMRIDRP